MNGSSVSHGYNVMVFDDPVEPTDEAARAVDGTLVFSDGFTESRCIGVAATILRCTGMIAEVFFRSKARVFSPNQLAAIHARFFPGSHHRCVMAPPRTKVRILKGFVRFCLVAFSAMEAF